MEVKDETKGGPHFVGKKDELIAAKRSFRTLDGRDILIVYHEGVLYAMDMYCYHAGGNLQNGDIEEFDGKLCIICPNHKYKITLAKGEGIYKATNPKEKPPVARWYSKGLKQRTHIVTETNGDVYVEISDEPGWVESDFFQGEKGKEERAKAEAAEMASEEAS
ncbi:Rieske domain-containing protein [Myripristis murdjan]|uniref:Rieske domain-containing protein n=1 Tax=Myripristis murdjan TaxID=586833 RepID=UPI001176437A|nr:Rieske domain-containing protein-like [Myripristis murdjan]